MHIFPNPVTYVRTGSSHYSLPTTYTVVKHFLYIIVRKLTCFLYAIMYIHANVCSYITIKFYDNLCKYLHNYIH